MAFGLAVGIRKRSAGGHSPAAGSPTGSGANFPTVAMRFTRCDRGPVAARWRQCPDEGRTKLKFLIDSTKPQCYKMFVSKSVTKPQRKFQFMKNFKQPKRISIIAACLLSLVGSLQLSIASPVSLQNATATFSQTFVGDFSVARAINGTTADDLGWAIAPNAGTIIPSQTAAFQTVSDIGFAGGSLITFTLTQTHSNPGHTLGRFRLSVTTDNRSLFCDGLATGGNVTANWTVLDPSSFASLNGTTFSKLGDLSLLAGGATPATDIYTVSAPTSLTGITGIRLEALEDPSLPYGGPGRWPGNGNFVLSEFQVGIVAVPEPTAGVIVALGGLILAAIRRSQHS